MARTKRVVITSTVQNLFFFSIEEENDNTITAGWTRSAKSFEALKTMVNDTGDSLSLSLYEC